jgi:hypothetical protein
MTMHFSRRTFALTFAFALALAATPAVAKELAGATMPDTLTVAGKTLKLNGMGLRKKAVFKVYVGGLYLEAPNANAAAILAADAPKALTMHFLRSIEKQKLVDARRLRGERRPEGRGPEGERREVLRTVTDVKEGSMTTHSYVPGTAPSSTATARTWRRSRGRISPRCSSPSGSGRSPRPRTFRRDFWAAEARTGKIRGGPGTLPPRI